MTYTVAFDDIVLYDAANGAGEAITLLGNVSGSIYCGSDTDVAIAVQDPNVTTAGVANDGVISGSIVIDDDADDTVDFAAMGLTAGSVIMNSFNSGIDKASTGTAFAIDLGALVGGITVEGDMAFTSLDVNTGNLGDITAGGRIGQAVTNDFAYDSPAGSLADIYEGTTVIAGTITVAAGSLGTITANDNVAADINIGETAFGGLVVKDGFYVGAVNVGCDIDTLLVTDGVVDTLGEFNGNITTESTGTATAVDPDADGDTGYFDIDSIAFYSATFSSDSNIAVTGTDAFVTLDGTAMTVVGLTDGSTVAVDESEGNVASTITVVGDLAGAITVDAGANSTDATRGTVNAITVQGSWSGSVTLDEYNEYSTADVVVNTITVWGNVTSTAVLAGATFNSVLDVNGNAIDAQNTPAPITIAGGDVVEIGSGTDNFVYLSGRYVTAEVGYLFGQVTSFDIDGFGATQVVSINYAAGTPSVRDMLLAGAYGRLSVIGREIDNDYIDFDNPADASLSTITVGPSVTITSMVVDGSIGDFTDSNSNIVNLFVSGDAGTIVAGRSIVNAFIGGNATEVSAMNTVARLHVEGSIGTVSGISLANIDVEGDCDNIAASVINNMFVVGDVDSISLSGFGRYAGVIRNSYLLDKDSNYADNFDFVGENGGDDFYNPAAIINSLVSSDEA